MNLLKFIFLLLPVWLARLREVNSTDENVKRLSKQDKLLSKLYFLVKDMDNADRSRGHAVPFKPLKSERIVGGKLAREQQFPWVVYFHAIAKSRNGTTSNFCGGTLIHPR